MTFVMPYFSGNLLQQNWDAISIALNSSAGIPTVHSFVGSGPITVPTEPLEIWYQNGGTGSGDIVPAAPISGTDDGKRLIIMLEAGGGDRVLADAIYTDNSVGDTNIFSSVTLVAILGTWYGISNQGMIIS